jgi:hypothetical protein
MDEKERKPTDRRTGVLKTGKSKRKNNKAKEKAQQETIALVETVLLLLLLHQGHG